LAAVDASLICLDIGCVISLKLYAAFGKFVDGLLKIVDRSARGRAGLGQDRYRGLGSAAKPIDGVPRAKTTARTADSRVKDSMNSNVLSVCVCWKIDSRCSWDARLDSSVKQ
jgi:hypothetical protein